jgi:hypothetical protein
LPAFTGVFELTPIYLVNLSPTLFPVAGVEATGGGYTGCFISTAEATEAAFFGTEWPISNIIGLFELIELLWLGNKRANGERKIGYGA